MKFIDKLGKFLHSVLLIFCDTVQKWVKKDGAKDSRQYSLVADSQI